MDVAYQGDWRDPSLPAIHIHDFREDDIGHGYPAVVVLADDDLLDDWGDRHELVARARTHAGPDGVVIIAPALPEDGPSAVLMQANIDLPAGADLLLDTSLARSPLWGLDERSTASLGRLAELVVLAGVACFPARSFRAGSRRNGISTTCRASPASRFGMRTVSATPTRGRGLVQREPGAGQRRPMARRIYPIGERTRSPAGGPHRRRAAQAGLHQLRREPPQRTCAAIASAFAGGLVRGARRRAAGSAERVAVPQRGRARAPN
jgi:hypothetical protein